MKIGIVSISSAVAPELFRSALKLASELKHELVVPLDPTTSYASDRFLFSASSVTERIASLKTLLYDESVDLIIAARGGYGAIELLPELFKLKHQIATKPLPKKVFLAGFSDATNLLLSLDGIENLQLVHGPSFINAFSPQASTGHKQAFDNLVQLASGSWKGYQDLNLQQVSGNPLNSLKLNFTGGNLAVISSLIGTTAMSDLSGRALFVEEISEKPHKIHRCLMQLKNSHLLDNLSAVVLGEFIDCEHAKGLGPNCMQAIKAVFSEYDYPVIAGFPAGHGQNNLPLPFNLELTLTLKSLQF